MIRPMKIQFFGASGGVTGSSYFLSEENNRGILVDFGMFQEGNDASVQHNATLLPIEAKHILGVVVTHAHLDHCGRLPMLIRMGYHGKIYMTEATKMLVELTLMDAVHVAEKNHRELLYSQEQVVRVLQNIVTVAYDQEIVLDTFSITFRDAGHILGSASIEITNTTEQKKIVFSGDLGNSLQELVRPTAIIDHADVVVIEATYGDRIHPEEDTTAILQQEINLVESSGGVLLLPAFSLDRTQALLHKLNHLKKEGKIAPETPIFLDSPMGIQATLIYEHFPRLYCVELAAHAKEENPFDFPGLTLVEDGKESNAIKNITGTKVIIAGSGMMSGGRILRHAMRYLPEITTRVMLVGYQAERTLGRHLQEGARHVLIDHESIAVNATVTTIHGMSAHADQPQLLHWLKQIQGVKKLFITHGEAEARIALQEKISEEIGTADTILPEIDAVYHY